MRKLNVWPLLLVLVLLMTAPGAYAEESFSMAGYDDETTNHVWAENLFFERMEQRTGVTLDLYQYTSSSSWAAAKADMLSGKTELPDALFKAALTTQETQAWYEAGKLIDLRPYLAEHAPNLWALLQNRPDWLAAITLPDGSIVALPYIDDLQFNNAMWINQQWLKRLNLEVPTTAEELTEVLRAFRDNDMNGNGKNDDEVPLTFSSLWDLRFLAHAFGINANDYYITMDENGKVSEILTMDANRRFLEWLCMLWEEKLIDRDGFSSIRALSGTTDQKAEIIYGILFSSTPAELVPVSAIEQYDLLEPLTYEGRQVYRDLTGDLIRGTFAITSACKDPAALVAWVDYLYTEEGFILAEAGMEGEEFDWNDDGTWLWVDNSETLSKVTLPRATMRSGTAMPGVTSIGFQQKLDDASTQRVISALARLRAIDTLPYPMVWLTQEQEDRVNELALQIARYAEQQMVWFVAGDVKLTDDTWTEFCQKVRELGVEEMVSIWQAAADARQ